MNLRRKIILAVVTVTLAGCALLLVTVGSYLAAHHREVEEESLRRDLARAQLALQERIETLRLLAGEYASWDAMAAYTRNPDARFLAATFDPSVLSDLRLSLVAVFGPGGGLLGSSQLGNDDGGLRRTIGDLIARRSRAEGGREAVSGVAPAGAQWALVSILPIAPAGAPPAGAFLALARPLAGTELALLSRRTVSGVVVTATEGGAATVSFTGSHVTGSTPVPLIDGSGWAGLRIERRRDPLSDRIPPALILAIILFAFFSGTMTIMHLDRWILRRIRQLAADAGAGARDMGGDELEVLSRRLSGVLGELERSTAGLRDSEGRLRAIVENAPMGIAVSINGTVVYANAAGLGTMAAASPEEFIGQPFLKFVSPEFKNVAAERAELTVTRGIPAPSIEYPVVRVDGLTIIMGVTSAPIEYGGSKAMLTFFRDVSDRRRADDELARYRDGLERLVRERTSSLSAANERLLHEVKERETVEALLRESEELYRTLIAASPVAVAVTDLSGAIQFASERFLSLLGYTNDSGVIGRGALTFVVPQDRAKVELMGERLLDCGPVRGEIELIRADGSSVPVEMSASLARDSEGRPAAKIGTFLDRTQRIEAQRRLQESEEMYRTLVQTAPVAVVVVTMDGRIRFASPRANDLFGVPEGKSLVGRGCADFLPPEAREEVMGNFVLAERQAYFPPTEMNLMRYDGTPFIGKASSGVIYDDAHRPTAIVTTFLDISRRREAERRLRASEANYRTLLQCLPVAVVEVDGEGRILFASASARTLFGIPGGTDVIGSSCFAFVAPGDRARLVESLQALGSVGYFPPQEVGLLRFDGSAFPGEASGSVVRDADDRPTSLVCAFADITERLRAEEGLQTALGRLEVRNVELTRLDRLKDDLIRDVTHELKTPVAKLRMQLELLARTAGQAPSSTDAASSLTAMGRSLTRLETVIANILGLARLDAGRNRFELAPAEIDTLVRDVVEEYRFVLEAGAVTLETDLAPVTLMTDREMLSHVLSNLLGNAVKYRSHARPPVIAVGARVAGDHLVLTVMDNGIGMTPEELPLAFDRFWQASEGAEGVGVGLALARGIVEGLGGTIELSSPGRDLGMMVTVTLPLG